jgi:hypothetical protein
MAGLDLDATDWDCQVWLGWIWMLQTGTARYGWVGFGCYVQTGTARHRWAKLLRSLTVNSLSYLDKIKY